MKFVINPKNYENEYLENLNNCFPNWGDLKTLDWVINRSFDNTKPDFFVINSDENEILAGSAISYRTLKFPDNSKHKIGIMTGSWTLPISRGMGCFTETIMKSLELVSDKNFSFLTAFVTQSNASFRRLQDAGSFLLPTNYIISQSLEHYSIANNSIEILENSHSNIEMIFNLRNDLLKNKIHFEYNFNDFENQFFKRLNPVFLLKINNEFAIIEETSKMFQLHFSTDYSYEIINKIVNWANGFRKEIIFFSSNRKIDFANNENFKVVDGFFTILKNKNVVNTDYESIFNTEFNIEYGDKM